MLRQSASLCAKKKTISTVFSSRVPRNRVQCAEKCAPQCNCGATVRAEKALKKKYTSEEVMALESKYSAHNYAPIPVVFQTAKNATIIDPEGRKYTDFLSAYSAVNQGHCHPRIAKVIKEQLERVQLSSRAFYSDRFGVFAQYMSEYFGYDKVLPANSGAEAVEGAVKLCRRWAYKNGVPSQEGVIIVADGNFHGRTTTIVSFSNDPEAREDYGPFTPGFVSVPFGDVAALEAAAASLKGRLAGILLEPIQGEAGVIVPQAGYLRAALKAAHDNGGLLITDEVQTGIARSGTLLAHYQDNVRPDIVILGKALSGGAYPVSAVLADNHVMDVFTPGSHGSTFGGNPMACAIAMEALQIVQDERLTERARELGEVFRSTLEPLTSHADVREVRGRGLLNAIEVSERVPKLAYKICIEMRDRGVLAKPTHGNIIRFSPPLTIPKADLVKACNTISKSFAAVLAAN